MFKNTVLLGFDFKEILGKLSRYVWPIFIIRMIGWKKKTELSLIKDQGPVVQS